MKFFRSGLFVLLLMAAGSAAAFAYLNPAVSAIGNYEMEQYARYVGWGVGAVAALISAVGLLLLHSLRAIFRRKKTAFNQAFIALLCVLPWLIFSWQLLGEPRLTPIARAVIDFGARPLFWGALVASGWSLLMLGLSFIPSKK